MGVSYYLVLDFTLLFVYLLSKAFYLFYAMLSAPRTLGEAKSFEMGEDLIEPWLSV